MPRARTRFLPLFVIALLALIAAPAFSALSMARVSTGAAGFAPICDTLGGLDHPEQTPAPGHAAHDCCTLCGFVAFGAAPPPPDFSSIDHPVAVSLAVWIVRAERLTYGAVRARAQARAPPLHS